MTQSVRDIGLEKHLGKERYDKFVELENLGASDALIGKAIKAARKRIPYFRAIYQEELANKQ